MYPICPAALLFRLLSFLHSWKLTNQWTATILCISQYICDVLQQSAGKLQVQREGTDVTLVGYGKMVGYNLKAAEQLEKEGISCEVSLESTLSPRKHLCAHCFMW